MDLKNIKSKLIGNDEERAVSPVIGVILMVAITVILAAVIATFVMDMGSSMDKEATSGAQMSFDDSDNELSVSLTSEGNADTWQVRGDYYNSSSSSWVSEGDYINMSGAGDTVTLKCEASPTGDYSLNDTATDSGTVTLVASDDGGETWTNVGTQDWDCST